MVLPHDRNALSLTAGIGRSAERSAERYLRRHGLVPLARNFRSRFGELDLIMRDEECIVFVEVRSRRRSTVVGAAESVDRHKQRRLTRAASFYIVRNPEVANAPMRFDVVAVEGSTLTWIRDAFRPSQ